MNKKEFSILVQKYQTQMYRIAYQIVGNEADARDAVEKGVWKAFEKRPGFWSEKRFSSWIFQIVKAEAITILKKQDIDQILLERFCLSLPEEDEQRKKLNAVIQNLPDDCRSEAILFYYCGLSVKEISDLRGESRETIKSRLKKGKSILRETFEVNGKNTGGRKQE